jgi:hypothetical protein
MSDVTPAEQIPQTHYADYAILLADYPQTFLPPDSIRRSREGFYDLAVCNFIAKEVAAYRGAEGETITFLSVSETFDLKSEAIAQQGDMVTIFTTLNPEDATERYEAIIQRPGGKSGVLITAVPNGGLLTQPEVDDKVHQLAQMTNDMKADGSRVERQLPKRPPILLRCLGRRAIAKPKSA